MPEEKFYLCMTDGSLHPKEEYEMPVQSGIVSYPSEGRVEEIDLGKEYRNMISNWENDGGK